jgi:hypothetical protein
LNLKELDINADGKMQPVATSVWNTFDIDLILNLLRRKDYKPQDPDQLLDKGMIDEAFDDWGEKKTEEFLTLINNYKIFNDYIVKNGFENLYPTSVKDMFIF